MPRYLFSYGSGDIRQSGMVRSDSFADALTLLSDNIAQATVGDTLEVGVPGFPPARFHLVWEGEGTAWRPMRVAA